MCFVMFVSRVQHVVGLVEAYSANKRRLRFDDVHDEIFLAVSFDDMDGDVGNGVGVGESVSCSMECEIVHLAQGGGVDVVVGKVRHEERVFEKEFDVVVCGWIA